MKRIYINIPEAPDVTHVVLHQLPGYLLENQLAERGCPRHVVQLECVDPRILCWLHEQYRMQCRATTSEHPEKIVNST